MLSPRELAGRSLLAGVCAVVAGCAGVHGNSSGSGAGNGGAGGSAITTGQGGSGSGNCERNMHAVVRDFRGFVVNGVPKHPDFEYAVSSDMGIVASTLGPDGKPVYVGGSSGTTTGADNFNQWYRDVTDVNIRFDVDIPLTPDPTRDGVFVYDDDTFFPIDNMGWGNQYQGHNFDFTTEIHFNFPYRGGEEFKFRGDDDVWLFVNGHLAIDLGGVHEAKEGSVNLDTRAAELGITPGNNYRMDIFQAERHVIYSTFHVETTLSCIDNVIIP